MLQLEKKSINNMDQNEKNTSVPKFKWTKTDPLVMQRQEQANAALEQTTQQQDNHQKQIEVAILQTQKIQALEENLHNKSQTAQQV